MREFLDDELKRRLADYKEEPDDDLWNKIIVNMPSLNTPPAWAVWTPRIAAFVGVVAVTSLMFVNGDKQSKEMFADTAKEVERQIPAMRQPGDTLETAGEENDRHENVASKQLKQNKEIDGQTARLIEKLNTNKNELTSTEHQDRFDTKSIFQPNDPLARRDSLTSRDVSIVNDTSFHDQVSEAREDSLSVERGSGKSVTIAETKEKKNKKHRLRNASLYLLAMPTFGYNRIEANTNDNIFIESIQRIPNFSFKRLGVRLEAGIEYPVSNRLTLTGGVLYYQRKQSIGYTERVVDSTVVVATSADSELSIEPHYNYIQKSFDYNLRNAGVHVGLNYIISQGRFLQSLGTGIEFHRDLSKRSDEEKGFEGENKPSTFVFYNLYYRLQYPAEGKLKAVFQPMLNYSLHLNKDFQAPFYVKPYGLGISIGLTYKF